MTGNNLTFYADAATYLACVCLMFHYALKKDGKGFLMAVIATAAWQISCTAPFDSKYKPYGNLGEWVDSPQTTANPPAKQEMRDD